MLKVKGRFIVDEKGKKVFLRGVNAGGWLMKEAYFMHAPSFPEKKFRSNFAKYHGEQALIDFDKRFRDNFIREADFKQIAKWGFNCIRLPFHFNAVESSPYTYTSAGLKYIDAALKWAEKYRVHVILDLHAVPGCQNHDWHSDSSGKADFWDKPGLRKRVYALWRFIAKRYKNSSYLAGYDLLNESVTKQTDLLNEYYHKAIAAIRREDKQRIVFIEGNMWATDIDCLDEFKDDNYVLSIHSYEPLNITFNLIPLLKYPCADKKFLSNFKTLEAHVTQYAKVAEQRNLPVYVGEFGVNYRNNDAGEVAWLKDTLKLFNRYDFHWTYWTYKAIKNFAFPDGILSYYENPPWVHREGPLTGWDTYHLHWTKSKTSMAASWQTEKFTLNDKVLKALKQYAC